MAADFTARVARAAGRIEPGWSPERAAAILRAVHGQKQRRAQRRVLGAVAVVLGLVVLTPRLVASLHTGRGSAENADPAGTPGSVAPRAAGLVLGASPLRLHDGSVVRLQGKMSQVRLREERPGRTVLELAGAAQFDVVHDPRRLFRVETHGLAVEVLGTQFLVVEQGPRVQVTVQKGRVRVLWASHYDELGAGQSGWFQPAPLADLGLLAATGGLPPLNEPAPVGAPLPPGVALPTPSQPGPVAATSQFPATVASPQLDEPAPVGAAPQRRTAVASPPVNASAPVAAPPPLPPGVAALQLHEAAPVGGPPLPVVVSSEHAGARAKGHRGLTRSKPAAPAMGPSAAVAVVVEAAPAVSEPSSWQTLAHEGLFEQAYRVAYAAPDAAAHHLAEPSLLREREVAPSELLLLADVARLSHHPAAAIAPLMRLLGEHAADPRAPLAAFTLGRVLLDDLGRPREAAQSFVRVQQLDPDGPLSQDALAREVEAWSRAGEAASARTRALQYVQKYPAGRRLRSVRHFGELL